MSALRNGLRKVASLKGEWAGIPMPISGRPIRIEPAYPKAAELMAIGREERDEDESGITVRNTWRSYRDGPADIYIFDDNGKIDWGRRRKPHGFNMMLDTLDASDAWGIEQEGNAVQTLGTMIRHRQFKQYMLTGMFLETSHRSGVTYVFRRLRPTVAFREGKILAALCLHPIGYYEGTWAGAMCPTDDVIAHLSLMRGDEHMFWKRSNQHHPLAPEAGL